jgi:LuxR family maltose regulon positive regulatory protein
MLQPLSTREHEVLILLAAGRSNRAIAEELFITVDTVKRHISHVFDKIGVTSRTQAAGRARELGLLG